MLELNFLLFCHHGEEIKCQELQEKEARARRLRSDVQRE